MYAPFAEDMNYTTSKMGN